MEHNCINKQIIEELRKEVQHLQTRYEVLESNVNAVKENIRDMKTNIKELRNEMSAGFSKINGKNIAILTGLSFALVGLIANIIAILVTKG